MYKVIKTERVVYDTKEVIMCDVCGRTEDSNIYQKGWAHLSKDNISVEGIHICNDCMKIMVKQLESVRISKVGEYYGVGKEDV